MNNQLLDELYARQIETVRNLLHCDAEAAERFLAPLWGGEIDPADIETIELFETIGNIVNFAESF